MSRALRRRVGRRAQDRADARVLREGARALREIGRRYAEFLSIPAPAFFVLRTDVGSVGYRWGSE